MPDWLRQLQTFGIFAAGYLARPLGGIIIAHFGDILGRKRMFTLSIFLMAAPTLVIGLLPTYASIGIAAPLLLLAMRVLQGAAIGGEMPGAWVFVGEHVPAQRYGFGIGTLTSGTTGGILLGSLVAVAINRYYLPAEVTTSPGAFPSCWAACSAWSRCTCAGSCTRHRSSRNWPTARPWRASCRCAPCCASTARRASTWGC
jgi:MFS family permease